MKRRLYGTILLLGGVSETPGLNRYLEWRIATCWKLAPDSTEGIERVEVFKLPPNVSPDCLVWRGAVELTSLKSARSMWLMSEARTGTGAGGGQLVFIHRNESSTPSSHHG